jgi:carbon-monoxide dehydrogenase iron sulfur subunit
MVCPYGVIGRRVEERIAVKCDLCPDRDVPACVEACPTKALIYAEEEAFSGVKRVEAAKLIAEGYLSGQAT